MIERVVGNAGFQETQTVETISAPHVYGSRLSAPDQQIVHNVGGNFVNWIGALNGLQLVTAAQALQLPPLTTNGSGVPTIAEYRTGPPAPPNVQHASGTVQNPNDATAIPVILASDPDRQVLKNLRNKLEWADRAQRFPTGADTATDEAGASERRDFSYDDFVRDDDAGKTTLQNATLDIQGGAEEIYRQMTDRDPKLKTEPVTFVITGSQIAVGHTDRFPSPETERWLKALPPHEIWMSATVTVSPGQQSNDPPRFSMRMSLHVMANYSTLERDVTWLGGHSEEGVLKPVYNRTRI